MLETFPSFDDQRGSKTISANYFCNDREGIFEHAFGKATNVLPAAKLRVDSPLFPALLPYPFEETATVLGFWSQYLMGRIFFEPFGFDCPDFADEFIGRQALE